MNDVYAIDPKAPSNINELSNLMRLFGNGEGRFIADYPSPWFNCIINLLNYLKLQS
jgi:hypothetical protein